LPAKKTNRQQQEAKENTRQKANMPVTSSDGHRAFYNPFAGGEFRPFAHPERVEDVVALLQALQPVTRGGITGLHQALGVSDAHDRSQVIEAKKGWMLRCSLQVDKRQGGEQNANAPNMDAACFIPV
jgi:hypothetical protein